MTLTFVPLLRVQRELYAMPRGMQRRGRSASAPAWRWR